MDGMILPILIAASAALVVFLGVQITAAMADPEKRKLKARLSGEQRGGGGSLGTAADGSEVRSITIYQQELGFLGRLPYMQTLARKLLQAYPDASFRKFLVVCLTFGFIVGSITFLLTANPAPAVIGAGIALYAPVLFVDNRRAKRQKMLSEQLPEALDFLSRILRAGHSLSTGLQMMSEELPQPMATEFRRAYDQHSLGQNMDDCLKAMSTRVESTDFAFFVTAVLIQRQTGGDLSEVLNNISEMIRQRMRLQNHVRAKTAEGRFTGYILTGFPAVMFGISYMLNPEYAGVLLHGKGLLLLGIAFGFCMMGLYCIKKITTVRV